MVALRPFLPGSVLTFGLIFEMCRGVPGSILKVLNYPWECPEVLVKNRRNADEPEVAGRAALASAKRKITKNGEQMNKTKIKRMKPADEPEVAGGVARTERLSP